MYIYTHIHIYIHIHTYICIHIIILYIYIYTYTYIHIYTSVSSRGFPGKRHNNNQHSIKTSAGQACCCATARHDSGCLYVLLDFNGG